MNWFLYDKELSLERVKAFNWQNTSAYRHIRRSAEADCRKFYNQTSLLPILTDTNIALAFEQKPFEQKPLQLVFCQNKYAKHHLKDQLQMCISKRTYELRSPIQGSWVFFASFHKLFDCNILNRWLSNFTFATNASQRKWAITMDTPWKHELFCWIPFDVETIITYLADILQQSHFHHMITSSYRLKHMMILSWWHCNQNSWSLTTFCKYDCLKKVSNCIFSGNQKIFYQLH